MKISWPKFRAWANKNDGELYQLPENPVLKPLEILGYIAFIFSMLLFLVADKLNLATKPHAIACLVIFVGFLCANAIMDRKDNDGGAA